MPSRDGSPMPMPLPPPLLMPLPPPLPLPLLLLSRLAWALLSVAAAAVGAHVGGDVDRAGPLLVAAVDGSRACGGSSSPFRSPWEILQTSERWRYIQHAGKNSSFVTFSAKMLSCLFRSCSRHRVPVLCWQLLLLHKKSATRAPC